MVKNFFSPAKHTESEAKANPACSLPAHIELARKGENFASAYLEGLGFKIIARNWRYGRLELDLICEDSACLVFIEVKTRRSADFGGPISAVNPAKQKLLCRAAAAWLSKNRAWERPARFDVVCLIGQGKNFQVEHYRNAFEFGTALDSRNSSWQPW